MGGRGVWSNQTWGHSPYHNHGQTTPPTRGQYCKKSYVGGDNNIERTQARRRTPAPPGACRRASIYNVKWGSHFLLVIARYAWIEGLRGLTWQDCMIACDCMVELDWLQAWSFNFANYHANQDLLYMCKAEKWLRGRNAFPRAFHMLSHMLFFHASHASHATNFLLLVCEDTR